MEHLSPYDTQLPFDMLFIVMFYTCRVTELVYHMGDNTCNTSENGQFLCLAQLV